MFRLSVAAFVAALASPASHGRTAVAASKAARAAPVPMTGTYQSLCLDIARF